MILQRYLFQAFGHKSCMQSVSHMSDLLYVPHTFYVLELNI